MAKKLIATATPTTLPDDPRWTPRAATLERVGLTRPTLEGLVRAGKIRKTTLGTKVYYSALDIDRLMAENATRLAPVA